MCLVCMRLSFEPPQCVQAQAWMDTHKGDTEVGALETISVPPQLLRREADAAGTGKIE